jgi:hypothetical protein
MTPSNFDLLVGKSGLSGEGLCELRTAISVQYPADPMMQDLRLVRTLHAIADGRATLEGVLTEFIDDWSGGVRRLGATRL